MLWSAFAREHTGFSYFRLFALSILSTDTGSSLIANSRECNVDAMDRPKEQGFRWFGIWFSESRPRTESDRTAGRQVFLRTTAGYSNLYGTGEV